MADLGVRGSRNAEIKHVRYARPAAAGSRRAADYAGGSFRLVPETQRAELDAWEPTSLSTDFPA